MMRRFELAYTGLASNEVGFGHPSNRCDESRSSPADIAASLFASPVLAARWEARKGLPVCASGSRLTNPSSCRPRLVTGAVVLANRTAWRPFMAQLTASLGKSARVFLHPNAAAAPVAQQRRAGRYPQSVTSLSRFVRDKRMARHKVQLLGAGLEQQRRTELQQQRSLVAKTECLLEVFKVELAQMERLSSTTPGAM